MQASLLAVLIAAVALGGCQRATVSGDSPQMRHGRYAGIGLYAADPLWSQMKVADKTKDQSSATTADDQTIIVVVDSETGEVRQCGNMSGYCVGMNPWTGPLGKERSAPASLSKHLAELGNDSAVSNEAEVVTENAQSR
ncbi:MAG: hypothetical protein WC729_23535 [Sphingomonas sp.]|jgi:hypothetical protein|uniref:hypothetical protein n=1 Tax=Sphingomonas sp. TaxID=28214 RepID=UPI003566887B